MDKFLKSLILSAIMLTGNALANCNEIRCTSQIKRLYVTTGGDVAIRTASDQSLLGCDLGPGNYLTLKKEHPGFDPIYSMMLTAHATEQTIAIRTSTTGPCDIAYVLWDK